MLQVIPASSSQVSVHNKKEIKMSNRKDDKLQIKFKLRVVETEIRFKLKWKKKRKFF